MSHHGTQRPPIWSSAGPVDAKGIPRRDERSPRLDVLILYAQPVFWSMGEGRGAVIFSRLPNAIAQRGHRVRVSLPGSPGTHGLFGEAGRAECEEYQEYHGFELHRRLARGGFVPDPDCPLLQRVARRVSCWLRYQRWGLAAARDLTRGAKPDLIIGMGFYEAPVARKLARELGVPNVTRLFGNSLALQLGRGLRFYANFPEIIALKTPAELVILNDDGADGERVADRLRVPRDRLVHLRNGVDFGLFTPGPPSKDIRRGLGLPAGTPILLTASRLAAEKKLERALDGLRGLLPFFPDAVLVLLGDGPEKERLMNQVRRDGLEGHVFFPGPVIQSELPDWYRSADIFLSLLDRTNAANPVFEAMACGRTVVVLDAGTTRSVVEDGRTGVVLAHDDLPRLGCVLAELLRDRPRMEDLGREASRMIPTLVMDLAERLHIEVDLIENVVFRYQNAARRAGK